MSDRDFNPTPLAHMPNIPVYPSKLEKHNKKL